MTTTSPSTESVLVARVLAAAVLVLLSSTARSARAQGPCDEQWLPGEGVPGVNGTVHAMTLWDPDGEGPLGPRVVVGGDFVLAGDVIANNIAAWDPATGEWFPFGDGLANQFAAISDTVLSIAVAPNGDVIVGGRFTTVARHVARWDRAAGQWTSMGNGVDYAVYAIAVLPNGDIITGGQIEGVMFPTGQSIRRWNGSDWVSMSFDGPYSNSVRALLVLPNGDLLAGGYIWIVAEAPSAKGVARWDGTSWSAMGAGMGTGTVDDFELLPDGSVVAVGDFDTIGGMTVNNIARWDGAAWTPVGAGIPGRISSVRRIPNGELVVDCSSSFHGGIARWNGSEWLPLGSGPVPNKGGYQFLVLASGELLVGGGPGFLVAGGVPIGSMGTWSSATELWSQIGQGINDSVVALLALQNGDWVLGGAFRTIGQVQANRIACWNRAEREWCALGSGMNGPVNALFQLPGGDVLAGGNFTEAGGVEVSGLARWDGVTWTAFPQPPVAAAVWDAWPDGTLLLGFSEWPDTGRLWIWDGGPSAQLIGQFDNEVSSFLCLEDGDVLAGGYFRNVNGVSANRIARWDAATGLWSALGSGTSSSVSAVAMLPNGEFVAGGGFSTAGGVPARNIARWDGSAWSALGAGTGHSVEDLAVLPNGDLIACGRFESAGNTPANRVARWNGSSWSSLGSGVDAWVTALEAGPLGDFMVSGSDVSVAGGHVSAYFARWGVPQNCCPADFDQNGVLEVFDLFGFLTAWFAGEPAAVGFEGVEGVPAIFAFLAAWFEGC